MHGDRLRQSGYDWRLKISFDSAAVRSGAQAPESTDDGSLSATLNDMSVLLRRRVTRWVGVASIVVALVAPFSLARHYSLSPLQFAEQAARVTGTPILGVLYRGDLDEVERVTGSYRIGGASPASSWKDSWTRATDEVRGLRILELPDAPEWPRETPFVYESADAGYLRSFRQRYQLDRLVATAASEYEAMLHLGAWVGSRWDHGDDALVGTEQMCDPSAVVAAGMQGAKYWCEVAARTLVHAATAVGWQARVMTASRDGYTWEHAVAELWSNDFNKWFVLDADFNVVYEHSGVPLSGFELMERGEQLTRSGGLVVRAIAPPKPSLPYVDLMPFYRYVHIDLRNDWCSRPLRRGSPAGGDLATWWTARKEFHPILTMKRRVDERSTFDWPVNVTTVHIVDAERIGDNVALWLSFSGYSPSFDHVEASVDNRPWRKVGGSRWQEEFGPGGHSIRARVVTGTGGVGPVFEARFENAVEN